jgi:hypothetical protein
VTLDVGSADPTYDPTYDYGHIDRGFLQELDITGDVVIGR